jgi:hypothetical protein
MLQWLQIKHIFEPSSLKSFDDGVLAVRVRKETLSPPTFGKEIC